MEIDIKHIVKLSKLVIEDDRFDDFQKNMQDIVNMVEKLPDIDTYEKSINEDNPMILREDAIKDSLRRDKLLSNAPETAAGCVVVPKTVE